MTFFFIQEEKNKGRQAKPIVKKFTNLEKLFSHRIALIFI